MTNNSRKKRKRTRLADVIAMHRGKLVLIKRLRKPYGLAFPGGHVDPGEAPKQAAIREFTEETGLTLHHVKFFTKRKGKRRDPRYAMSETRVYIGSATGKIQNEKGFTKVVLMKPENVPIFQKDRFAFDHLSILRKYFEKLLNAKRAIALFFVCIGQTLH